MSEIPSFQDELDRKVAETCDLLGRQLERGDIDMNQYAAALRALDGATRGLVMQDISFWIDDRLRSIKEHNSLVALRREQELVIFDRAHGDDRFVAHKFKIAGYKPIEYAYEEGDMVAESKKAMSRLVEKMKSVGYAEISQREGSL